MIYIHRDWEAIPREIRDNLEAAALALDAITDIDERKAFIAQNTDKWAAVRAYLCEMSNGKCWYSEAREKVSRYQVDHFRPHGRAKQAPKNYSEGYSWLAFELDNFRLAGMLCNTANREYAEGTTGKSDWFPLADPTKRACLASPDHSKETPVLLDPTDPDDPCKLAFSDDGNVAADSDLAPEVREHVELSITYLGLRQSQLNGARRTTWRRCLKKIKQYSRIAKKKKGERTADESQLLLEFREELLGMSRASSEFAAVARSCLKANRLPQFVVSDELLPLAAIQD